MQFATRAKSEDTIAVVSNSKFPDEAGPCSCNAGVFAFKSTRGECAETTRNI
jgi:hypothetical protein